MEADLSHNPFLTPLPPPWTPSQQEKLEVYTRTVHSNPLIPHTPHPKQTLFLTNQSREILYGGAAGGGKTDAILAAALQYADEPGYSALLLRRTFRDLQQPDGLVPRAAEWLRDKATWSAANKRWTFERGGTLTFGYLDSDNDVYQYQGAAYQFIGFDELTQFTEFQYRYLFSRLRRTAATPDIPLRMRAGSNPGGIGHDWVKRRFISNPENRVFLPAKLEDNPSLDYSSYVDSLMQLDPVTRAQLLAGDWDSYAGGRFQQSWFLKFRQEGEVYHLFGRTEPVKLIDCWYLTIVDPATTAEQTTQKGDPDYTVILTCAITPKNDLLVVDVVRKRLAIDEIVPALATVCEYWKPLYVGIESVAFQAAIVLQARQDTRIPAVRGIKPGVMGKSVPGQRGKLTRATPAIVRAEAGGIFVPDYAVWLEDFISELTRFTGDAKLDAHDDQVDALAYAVLEIDHGRGRGVPVITDISRDADKVLERLRPPASQIRKSNQTKRGLFGLKRR